LILFIWKLLRILYKLHAGAAWFKTGGTDRYYPTYMS
jgi:hypothetical protein